MKGRRIVSQIECRDMGGKPVTLTFLISSFYSVHELQGMFSTYLQGVVLYPAYIAQPQSKAHVPKKTHIDRDVRPLRKIPFRPDRTGSFCMVHLPGRAGEVVEFHLRIRIWLSLSKDGVPVKPRAKRGRARSKPSCVNGKYGRDDGMHVRLNRTVGMWGKLMVDMGEIGLAGPNMTDILGHLARRRAASHLSIS